MARDRTRGYSLIGVDLAPTAMRAAQLRFTPNGPSLAAHVVIERQDPSEPIGPRDGARLAGVLHRRGFRGNQMVIGAAQASLRREILTLPPLDSGAPVESIARAEIAQGLANVEGGFELAMWELRGRARGASGVEVLAAICPHVDAQARLDLFAGAGAEVMAIDVPCWAMARACAPLIGPTETVVLLDLAWDTHTLSVLQRGGVAYERELSEAAYATLVNAVAKSLDVEIPLAWRAVRQGQLDREACDPMVLRAVDPLIRNAIDQLVREVRTSLGFVRHRHAGDRLERVLVVGEALGLADRIRAELKVDSKALHAEDLVEIPDAAGDEARGGLLTRAIGYALWEGRA